MSTRKLIKNGTKSSKFGTSGRINHDSSGFYDSKLYKELGLDQSKPPYIENKIHDKYLNKIFAHSSEKMDELPDNSVHLMVTSPPYNVGKEYDEDLSLHDYLGLLKRVWKEVYRVLVPGGRAAINVANLGRKPYIPLHSYIINDMNDLGFLMRGEIIWNKSSGGSPSTAWGSWMSASNPILRDAHEYILIFSKGDYSRNNIEKKKNTIKKEEFLEFTKSVWNFAAVSAKKIGHPAPFPYELPYRLIQLYTFTGDVVLDPFVGSGQTAIAALLNNRNSIGYDVSNEYVELCRKRIREVMLKNSNGELFLVK